MQDDRVLVLRWSTRPATTPARTLCGGPGPGPPAGGGRTPAARAQGRGQSGTFPRFLVLFLLISSIRYSSIQVYLSVCLHKALKIEN